MIKTLAREIKEYKRDSIITPIFMVLEVIMDMIIPLLMGSIIDNGVNKGDIGYIVKVGMVMLVAAGFGLFTGVMGGKYGASASAGFAKNLRKAMFENIQTFSFSNIDRFSSASLVTRMTTDVTNVQNSYQMLLRMCVRAPLSLIIAMCMSFYVNAKVATIYLCAVIFLAFALLLIGSFAMKYFKSMFRKYDDVNASVQEDVTASRVVKAYVREDYEKKVFGKANEALYKLGKRAERIVSWNAPVMTFTIYACILLISWIGAKMVVGGSLSTGDLMTLLAYCMNILMNLMMLSMVYIMLSMSAASAERISEVLNEKADIVNPENPVYEIPDGSIVFDHVCFSYNKDAKNHVLNDINLRIESGETIGIIGGTGSAKTSMVNLISRLYDVTEGSLMVGGRDVREYDLKVLRDKVSVVLQKNELFTGTILENLRWGKKDATLEEVKRACRLACVDDYIEEKPDGYDSFIEQGGNNVSGGQKQRLCIARALLKDPKILILDDSTSAVDTATDARIRKAFREEIPHITKLIIAQRISSVMDSDRIIVLDNGTINGFGTHEELMESNKIYREVYESQTKGGGDFDENMM